MYKSISRHVYPKIRFEMSNEISAYGKYRKFFTGFSFLLAKHLLTLAHSLLTVDSLNFPRSVDIILMRFLLQLYTGDESKKLHES